MLENFTKCRVSAKDWFSFKLRRISIKDRYVFLMGLFTYQNNLVLISSIEKYSVNNFFEWESLVKVNVLLGTVIRNLSIKITYWIGHVNALIKNWDF